MINPFKSIEDNTKDKEKKAFHKRIEAKAWDITKKTMIGKTTNKDVLEMEVLYKEYFKKYPDPKKEAESKNRLKKLRQII